MIDRPVRPELSTEEAHALLWAVRNIDSDSLRRGPYHGDYDQACGHGALSSATNRLEATLGEVLKGVQAMTNEELMEALRRTRAIVSAAFVAPEGVHPSVEQLDRIATRAVAFREVLREILEEAKS